LRRANVGTGERSASERGIEWIREASTRKRPLEVVVEVAAAVRIFDIDGLESRLKLEYSGSASFEVVVIVD